jgi:hypothetical protein
MAVRFVLLVDKVAGFLLWFMLYDVIHAMVRMQCHFCSSDKLTSESEINEARTGRLDICLMRTLFPPIIRNVHWFSEIWYWKSAPNLRNETKFRLNIFTINCYILKPWKKTPWPESASELNRPSDFRRLSAKLVPILPIEIATWSAWRIPTAVFAVFWTGAPIFSSK